jgi:MFS family permease
MIYLPMNLAFVIGPFTASFVARSLQVRDVFLVSAAWSFLALLIFATNVRRTREKNAG